MWMRILTPVLLLVANVVSLPRQLHPRPRTRSYGAAPGTGPYQVLLVGTSFVAIVTARQPRARRGSRSTATS